MRYKEFVTELRKNPDQNPKVTVNSELAAELARSLKNTGDTSNLFVSFTSIDKLGINPMSKYQTPLGIYSYPADYVERKIGINKPMSNLPFAGDSPYATIFKSKGNIINLPEMSAAEANEYYEKIANLWSKKSGKPWKTSVDEIESIINDASSKAKFSNDVGGRFWYVTMKVSELIGKVASEKENWDEFDNNLNKTSHPIAWNNLFRSIGIAGCIDTGVGIIHTSEKAQAVFFDIGAINVIKRVYNKLNYIPDTLAQSKIQGLDTKNYHTKQYKKFRTMDVKSQIEAVLNDPNLIRFMPNPPDDLKYKVVEKRPSVIGFMKNPSDDLKYRAVELNPSVVFSIKKLSEKLLLFAIEKDSNIIKAFAKNGIRPSESIQRLVLEKSGHLLSYIVDAGVMPSEEIQRLAMSKGGSISSIIEAGLTPSETVQQIYVSRTGSVIDILNAKIKPSETVQRIAASRFGRSIVSIISAGIKPSEAVQQLAVTNDPKIIVNIIHAKIKPSDAVQIAAIEKNPEVFEDILTTGFIPSETVQLAGVNNNRRGLRNLVDAGIIPNKKVELQSGVSLNALVRFMIKNNENPSEALKQAAGIQ